VVAGLGQANARKGFRRAWADSRAAGWVINKKKVQRLWREEGLRVKVRKIRKRAGAGATPLTEADAPKVVWAIDFQFDSTTDGRKFKIASMVDEHTRQSVLNIVERSIPAEDLVAALEKAFALWGGPPQVLRCDNGPEFISEALRRSARIRSGSATFHLVSRGRTGTSNPSTIVSVTSA